MGLQHKSVDDLHKVLDLPTSQILGFFNKTVKKLVDVSSCLFPYVLRSFLIFNFSLQVLNRMQESAVEQEIDSSTAKKLNKDSETSKRPFNEENSVCFKRIIPKFLGCTPKLFKKMHEVIFCSSYCRRQKTMQMRRYRLTQRRTSQSNSSRR